MGWFGSSRKEGGGGRRHHESRNNDSPLSSSEYHREEDDVVQDVVNPVSAPVVSTYVAPSPVQGISEVVSSTGHKEDGGGVLLSRDETADSFDDVNGNTSSFTRGTDVDAENAMFAEDSKNNHINSLFNGHLMKWKFEAEEGTGFLRVPACKSCAWLAGCFNSSATPPPVPSCQITYVSHKRRTQSSAPLVC
jgi:hypothetical protein